VTAASRAGGCFFHSKRRTRCDFYFVMLGVSDVEYVESHASSQSTSPEVAPPRARRRAGRDAIRLFKTRF
jgi:hypothetical protein